MKKKTPASRRTTTLRGRAETKLKKQKKEDRPAADTDLRKLLQELQVHHIGLEVQNEELRRAQQELEASHSKYVALYDVAPVGYFTLDSTATILEVNLTGAVMLGVESSRLINKAFTGFVAGSSRDIYWLYLKRVFNDNKRERCEVKLLKQDGTECYAQLESVAVMDSAKTSSCCQMIAIDITERTLAEQEKEKLFVELQQAMEKIKMLSGMLPICSSCKKVRDDKGYWNQIEAYISDHAEVEFTHSICPECAKKLYPDFYKDSK